MTRVQQGNGFKVGQSGLYVSCLEVLGCLSSRVGGDVEGPVQSTVPGT